MSLQTAESLLEKAQDRTEQMNSYERQHQREKLAKEIINGELDAAFSEIDKAAAQGTDVSATRARACFAHGITLLTVAESPEIESFFTAVIINKAMRKKYAQKFVNKWAGQALAEFNKSLQLMPTQKAHLQAGVALLHMNRKPESQAALEKAQQGDDHRAASEAAQTIALMNQKTGFCFVATACYGSYDHPDVMIFRRWRDEVLMSSVPGRAFVRLYYALSPPLAHRIERKPRLSQTIRTSILEPLARFMQRRFHHE